MTHSFNAFSHPTCVLHTLSKNTNHKFFLSNMICNWSLIHRKFKSVPYPIAVKSCIRTSQIPYLKANSIFKNSFVIYNLNKLIMIFQVKVGMESKDVHCIGLTTCRNGMVLLLFFSNKYCLGPVTYFHRNGPLYNRVCTCLKST